MARLGNGIGEFCTAPQAPGPRRFFGGSMRNLQKAAVDAATTPLQAWQGVAFKLCNRATLSMGRKWGLEPGAFCVMRGYIF